MYAEGADGKLELVKVYAEDDDDDEDDDYHAQGYDYEAFDIPKTRYEHCSFLVENIYDCNYNNCQSRPV